MLVEGSAWQGELHTKSMRQAGVHTKYVNQNSLFLDFSLTDSQKHPFFLDPHLTGLLK